MSVTVSVIMPVHHTARHAGRALASVLATRIPDGVGVELIVVDDASTGGSAAVEPLLRDAPFPATTMSASGAAEVSAARSPGSTQSSPPTNQT